MTETSRAATPQGRTASPTRRTSSGSSPPASRDGRSARSRSVITPRSAASAAACTAKDGVSADAA
ncbi:hypothetical protein LUX57_21800 [Actinomadura madurae]|nr:hypothetical protein [Actinomadura madurae]MCP9967429.1 hypothetical protein [Actinomadura madurae]